jgi:IS1 family transposase
LALFKKLWIFKAYDRTEKRLLAFEFGDRSNKTFKRLFNRLKKWKILFYCTDHWFGFRKIIPQNHLFQGKDKTFWIAQNNGRQRHWFARFRRKTLAKSRPLEMAEITMRIFAAIHVNKTLKINHTIFG